ncbi:MAG: FtsX-like permease family protein, partial [Mycobacterium sp.]
GATVARAAGSAGTIGASALLRAPKRVWATTMTVMIGVAATVAVGGASANLISSAASSFDSLADIDVFISAEPMEAFPTGPLLPDDLRARVEAVPGVERVTQGQMANATLGRSRVIVQAIQPGTPNDAFDALRPGTAERMAAGEGIAVSRDVADALGVGEGERVRLPTPTGAREVTVLQVIPFFSIVGGVVLMDFDVFESWYQRFGATALNVFFADGADSEAVTARVREVVPADLNVETGTHAVESVAAGVGQGAAMSNAILWIICFVATVALLNTLMLSVLERRRELAVLRAIGAPRALVLRSVLAEAAGIGVVGAGLGIVVGAVTQYLATSALSQVMTIDVDYQPSPLILVYGVVALGLTLIGSLPPALSAARMPIIRALAVD